MLRSYWGWIKTSAGDSVRENAADTSYMSTVLATLLELSVLRLWESQENCSNQALGKKCKRSE